MNHYSLGELLPILAPAAEGGLCYNDTGGPGGSNRVTNAINEALRRLYRKMGSTGLIECVQMCVHNGCVTCPRDIEKILKARIDGTYAHVFDKWYEYLEGGPGMLEDDSTSYVDLIDRGLVPVQYDMPECMRVAVFSDKAETVDSEILIRGFDEHGMEVRSQAADGSWYMGEYIPITQNVLYYSNNVFSQISHVIKPYTNGYVCLSAYDQDSFPIATQITREHLAWYHPDETHPMYRRYGFKTNAYTELEDYDYRLNALVKFKFVPLRHESDLCRIPNIEAIEMMMRSIRYAKAENPEKALQYENLAEKLLLEDTEDHETVEAKMEIQVEGWGLGDIENV